MIVIQGNGSMSSRLHSDDLPLLPRRWRPNRGGIKRSSGKRIRGLRGRKSGVVSWQWANLLIRRPPWHRRGEIEVVIGIGYESL